eukprot:Hpha_TRINITY_DN16847_c1_g11::TRINITY_DN16847_c1_g11_i1::g.148988::m.148988
MPPPPSPTSPWSFFSVDSRCVTGLGLTVGVGTCATVRGEFRNLVETEVEGGVSKLLEAVESGAVQTEGHLVCTVSGMCTVGWNAVQCYDHIAQSARFVSVLMPAAEVPTYIGVATGRILSGNVSGTRTRYVTMIGGCVELSASLADGAAIRSVPFMAATEVGAHLFREGLAVGLERWLQNGGGEVTVWGAKMDPGDELTMNSRDDEETTTTTTTTDILGKKGQLDPLPPVRKFVYSFTV